MDDPEIRSSPKKHSETVDFCPIVRSFRTEYGSVYEKLPDGTFRRHKYDGTEYEPMEWTMFTDQEGRKDFLTAKNMLSWPKRTNVIFFMIAEYDQDGNCKKIVSRRDEILDVNDGFDLLTFVNDGKGGESEIVLQTAITFTPKIGYGVFEFSSNGEYHHGDIVSNIETKAEL